MKAAEARALSRENAGGRDIDSYVNHVYYHIRKAAVYGEYQLVNPFRVHLSPPIAVPTPEVLLAVRIRLEEAGYTWLEQRDQQFPAKVHLTISW